MLNSNDSVSVAFELMLHELGLEVADLNARGARYFSQSEYDKAESLSQSGRALADFRGRVVKLQEEWLERFSGHFADRESAQQVEQIARTISSASKAPKTRLRIIFPDGLVLDENTAALSFAKAVQHLGLQEVMRLNKRVNREPLIADTPSVRYNDTLIGDFYIRTHSSTKDKRDLLEEIARELGVGLRVEIV